MAKEKRPAYPTRKTCECQELDGPDAQPEWEWEFENIWACLGCGLAINGATGEEI